MSKLPEEHKFIDLSDYGRPVAKIIANYLKNTIFTPIHVTIGFIIAGFLAIYCMLEKLILVCCFFFNFKINFRCCRWGVSSSKTKAFLYGTLS